MSGPAVLPPRDDGFVRKKWTVQECRFLTESGLLMPGKYELIEGEIIFKMGQGRLHIAVITRIVAALVAIFGAEAIQNQAQIGIGEIDEFNDPEPDVAVLKGLVTDYLEREPDPATEVLLAVEAANTTLQGDTTTKAHIYAQHGLPEYWVVAIPHRTLIVHRQPTPTGYADIQVLDKAGSVAPLAAPNSIVRVADLLP
ncbi:MAG TPA: Uma2 family endonuclease [Chthonomonadaceae bacterium]|nr:Uma2 family endonuclease [Chthonomonadaceae bacterium]